MKMKKILCSILAIAMILGTMGISVSAEAQSWAEMADTSWYVAGETEFQIDSAAELAGVAKLVNEGTESFANKTVKLVQDIDLEQIDWVSIGTASNAFLGTFDGGDNTISNLWCAADNNGLFGYTSSGNRAEGYGNEAIIKNFTIDGAVVTDNLQKHNGAGAVVGCGNMYTTIQNINVKGQIIITGQRAGGILGYAYSSAIIDNCHVDGASEENDSCIQALFWACGGIMGFASPNDGSVHISNCSVKNMAVQAVNHYCAGGILGVGGAGEVENVAVENVECSIAYGDNIFYVSGGPTATGEVYVSNVVAEVNGEVVDVTGEDLSNVVNPVASVNGKYYINLKSAIDDAVALATEEAPVTVELKAGVHEVGSILFPATSANIILEGAGNNASTYATVGNKATVLKNSSLNAANGSTVDYQNITIKNIGFDNSYILFSGGRANVTYKNWMIDNCEFYNITDANALNFSEGSIERGMENFTFTNNVISGVTGASKSGLVLRASKGNVLIANNVVDNVNWNAIQCINVAEGTNLVIKENTLSSGADEGVLNLYGVSGVTLVDNVITTTENQSEIAHFVPVAKIGDTYYKSLEGAINGAKDGDTITILAGNYKGFDIPNTKNNLIVVGETDAEGNNLVTIETLTQDVTSHNGGIFVGSENTTIKNLNFTAGDVMAKGGWMSSSVGNTNGDTGMSSALKNLTVENCNFTGSGVLQAIWTNQGNVTVKNCSIKNYALGIDNYATGADQVLTVENSDISGTDNAVHTGGAVAGAKFIIKDTDIDSKKIDLGGAVAVTVTGGTIKNAVVTTYSASTFSVSEAALYDTSYAIDGTGSITLDAVYANNMDELAETAKAENITFDTYYKYEEDLGTGNTVKVPLATNTIYVRFEDVTDTKAEGEKVYDINLVASDNEVINRLNSADLTFAFTANGGDIAYEISESNKEVQINPVENSTVRYEFHYKGKEGTITDTQKTINIGRVRFEGYGKFTFGVDSSKTTNVVHATTVADNIVDTFTPNGVVANGEGKLELGNGTGEVTIEVPTKDLTVNIAFPNAVKDNPIAYQDMKVVISGDDLAPVTIKLGEDAEKTAIVADNRADASFKADFVNGSYVVKVTDALTVNTSYDITVSGAGYRTARYTVRMTDDKTVNFWNNVKDADAYMEVSKQGNKAPAKLNYLAGDIVKDNKINTYDLSAVVSYFGETGLSATNNKDYAKYDLNRDGFIDSKDVAIVLVSWGN